jgi:hypothetical protein
MHKYIHLEKLPYGNVIYSVLDKACDMHNLWTHKWQIET